MRTTLIGSSIIAMSIEHMSPDEYNRHLAEGEQADLNAGTIPHHQRAAHPADTEETIGAHPDDKARVAAQIEQASTSTVDPDLE